MFLRGEEKVSGVREPGWQVWSMRVVDALGWLEVTMVRRTAVQRAALTEGAVMFLRSKLEYGGRNLPTSIFPVRPVAFVLAGRAEFPM